MSRIVKVSENNYKLQVQTGGVITLDTGNQTGRVVVTGDLAVLGNTTTVESETLNVKDNIIYLNSGETGAGVTLQTSGIQIDRGTALDALLIFDETINHYNPTLGTTTFGTFSFKLTNGLMRGIKTNSITTGGSNLGLINAGTGVVTVTGTTNYHDQVQNGSDPDVLVTRGWVTRYVDSSGYPNGIAIVDRLYRSDTGVQAYDTSLDGGTSNIKLKFDNVVKATFNATTFNMNTQLDINGKTAAIGTISGGGASGGNISIGPDSDHAGNLTVNQSTLTTYSGVINGYGTFNKDGPGSLKLSSVNIYSGSTTITNGEIIITVTNAIPNTALIFSNTGRLLLLTSGVSQLCKEGGVKFVIKRGSS